jgi:hypothetical protein
MNCFQYSDSNCSDAWNSIISYLCRKKLFLERRGKALWRMFMSIFKIKLTGRGLLVVIEKFLGSDGLEVKFVDDLESRDFCNMNCF